MKANLLFIPLLFLLACRQNSPEFCRVVVSMQWTSADSAMLRKISLDGTQSKKIGSQLLMVSTDSAVFELPVSSDSLYQVSLKFSGNKLLIIPDCPYIRIVMNAKTKKNTLSGSPLSSLLFRFNEEQDSLAALSRSHQAQWSDFKITDNRQGADSMLKLMAGLNSVIQQRYSHFADTVSNSVLYMLNYDHIDFQNDYQRMKTMSAKAVERFPNSLPVRWLQQQVLNLVHIQEAELNTGDPFPVIHLPRLDGGFYSTDSARGKYVFIDFWASWCGRCQLYDNITRKLAKEGRFKNLVLIHVAMDDHLELCRKIVTAEQLSGIQLIDEEMWQGQTANKLAFDSIPFNYLLGPDQLILAKAIPPDSILHTLNKFLR
jgi:thiol-disulfide isomerase/thioredoxin